MVTLSKPREPKEKKEKVCPYKSLGIDPQCKCFCKMHPRARRKLVACLQDGRTGRMTIRAARSGSGLRPVRVHVSRDYPSDPLWVQVL